jgi:hypothetical protein
MSPFTHDHLSPVFPCVSSRGCGEMEVFDPKSWLTYEAAVFNLRHARTV